LIHAQEFAMSTTGSTVQVTSSDDENAVRLLYHRVLALWNECNAPALAALFTADSHIIGFDGSQFIGAVAITTSIAQIFVDSATPRYVAKIREVRMLSEEIAFLRAVAGMIPREQSMLDPRLNAFQTLIAVKRMGQWQIMHFQNTPAQFLGRPDLAQALTAELRALV